MGDGVFSHTSPRPSSEVQALPEELLDDPPGYRQDDLRGCCEMLWVTLRRIHRHAPVIESHTSLKNKRWIKNCLILKSRRLTCPDTRSVHTDITEPQATLQLV